MQLLQTEMLTKTYGSQEACVHALCGVSVGFDQGEFCAITGPSGSGKSTMLQLLGGLDTPTDGRVFFRGKEIHTLSDQEIAILRRRQFGFVFQAYNLVPELTAYENILLPVLLDGRKPNEPYLEKLVTMLGLKDRLDHLPSALSGGQQQRVAIARALANQPAVVFADEPTGNLDGKSGQEVLALLRYAQQEFGPTLILVTHDLRIAEQASRIIRLEDGRITSDTGVNTGEK